MSFQTTDLCDAHSDHLRVVAPMFKQFGGQVKFSGQVVTLKLFEDNSLVRDTLAKPGAGRVLVVDGGVDEGLLAGEERVRARPHFDVQLRHGGAAGHDEFAVVEHFAVRVILGVNLLFHWRTPSKRA